MSFSLVSSVPGPHGFFCGLDSFLHQDTPSAWDPKAKNQEPVWPNLRTSQNLSIRRFWGIFKSHLPTYA